MKRRLQQFLILPLIDESSNDKFFCPISGVFAHSLASVDSKTHESLGKQAALELCDVLDLLHGYHCKLLVQVEK